MREGLIVSEGDRHRLQRKVVQRLFSRSGLKAMGEMIQEKADQVGSWRLHSSTPFLCAARRSDEILTTIQSQLRDIMLDLTTTPTATSPYCPNPVPAEQINQSIREVDIYSATSRLTYDLIGLISIDHTFDSVGDWNGKGGKMFELYEHMQQWCQGSSGIRQTLTLVFPWIDWISVSCRFQSRYTCSVVRFCREHN